MDNLINCVECELKCDRDVYHLRSMCPLHTRTIAECDNKSVFQCWNCPTIVTHRNFYCQGCGRKVYPYCNICKTMNAHPVGFCNLDEDKLDTIITAELVVDNPPKKNTEITANKPLITTTATATTRKYPVLWSHVVNKPDDIVDLPKVPVPIIIPVDTQTRSNAFPCHCVFCQRTSGKVKSPENVNNYNCTFCNNEFFHEKHNCPKYVKNSNTCLFCFKEYGSENGHRRGGNCSAYRNLVFCNICNRSRNHCGKHCIKESK